MSGVRKVKSQIATIDCSLITIETAAGEFGFDTANKIAVEPQIEEEDAVKLVVKGIVRAQKGKVTTITGHKITLTDNLFVPDLVKVIQGGTIRYDEAGEYVGYTPPVAGSADKGEPFKLNAYSAQYDAAGQIVKYEKISYPNCTGEPVAFGSEDGAFRAPEYTINSAPKTGEAPYDINYVTALPTLIDEYILSQLTVTSVAGALSGNTTITVAPTKAAGNSYKYKTSATTIDLPAYGVIPTGYTAWDGTTDITATTGNYIAIIELDAAGKAVAGGTTTVTSKA